MNFRLLVLLIMLFSFLSAFAQEKISFGKLTADEKNFTRYEKDSAANAIVLYEKGDNYFEVINQRIQLVKVYHAKIKILNEEGFDEADISIPFYHSKDAAEKVTEIKAMTHNGSQQIYVSSSKIFENDLSDRVSEKRFTFANVKKGSIIEYTYKLISPYLYNLDGWEFQSNIPKLYSEFNAKIPANYRYNRSLVGYLKLHVNEADIKKGCFYISGYPNPADCEVLKYVMVDIPAFKADDDYMLAPSNYISRLDFELSSYRRLNGTTDEYTKSWKDVDREFKTDKDIGRQLTKKGFFEKNVPESLLTEGDALTRAKNIYSFVQNHYTWDGRHSAYGKARVKDAFNSKKGNAWEINMSLINLLNTAGIKTNLMLTSTRNNGLPKKTHPVIADFNYVIAKTEIDGKDYLLDATDKYMPFGMLPFKVLNHFGRVMDFKNDSYWYDIKPETNNKYQIRASMKFNVEDENADGIFDVVTKGYPATDTHRNLDKYNEDAYLERMEKSISGDFEITEYTLRKEEDEQFVSERFGFEMGNIINGETVYFNPFFVRFFQENPFLEEERNYPIDFGYPVQYRYQISIVLPEGYTVQELPEKVGLSLGENRAAVLQFNHNQNLNNISFSFDLSLNYSHFLASDYELLKDLFKQVTNIQNNSLVVLKKE